MLTVHIFVMHLHWKALKDQRFYIVAHRISLYYFKQQGFPTYNL